MTLWLVDIHPVYQAGLTVQALKAVNVSALMCKVTEGTIIYRPGYHDFSAQAKSAGMLFAAYHFLRAEDSGELQARYMKGKMGADWGVVPVMLDWESATTGSQAGKGIADAFVAECDKLGCRVVLNYLPHWYWQQIGSPDLTTGPISKVPLIASNYGTNDQGSPLQLYPGDTSTRWSGYGGRSVDILQFGSNCRIQGYGGPLDINAFRGTYDQLAEIFGKRVTVPDVALKDESIGIPAVPVIERDPASATHAQADAVLGYTLARTKTLQIGLDNLRTILTSMVEGLTNIDNGITELRHAVANLGTSGGQIDVAAIARAVADEQYRRQAE